MATCAATRAPSPIADSVGVGMLPHRPAPVHRRRQLHRRRARCPFQIPLGALIPQRVENLLPAGKNIGTTHITNGCYRLHPVEWNIGEAAGALAAFCLDADRRDRRAPSATTPRASADFQARLDRRRRRAALARRSAAY